MKILRKTLLIFKWVVMMVALSNYDQVIFQPDKEYTLSYSELQTMKNYG